MTPRAYETLDELIDRVAADVTRVPADGGFGERVAARLDRRPPVLPTWIPLTAAAALIVGALAVTLMPRSSPEHIAADSSPLRDADDPATASESPAALSVLPGRDESPPLSPEMRPARPALARATPSSIPPLEAPAVLAMDDLALEALVVPAVEIEDLDVATLAIDELTTVPESKE